MYFIFFLLLSLLLQQQQQQLLLLFIVYFRKDIPQRRVRRWGFSIHELLKDPVGRDLFRRFLDKEYSSENLRFYDLCNCLRYATNKDVVNKVVEIYK